MSDETEETQQLAIGMLKLADGYNTAQIFTALTAVLVELIKQQPKASWDTIIKHHEMVVINRLAELR